MIIVGENHRMKAKRHYGIRNMKGTVSKLY